jgi:hypothetical protein
MPAVPSFRSINETAKPLVRRVYHNHSECPSGRDISSSDRQAGSAGYRLCAECGRLSWGGVYSGSARQPGHRHAVL